MKAPVKSIQLEQEQALYLNQDHSCKHFSESEWGKM
jgi:hypothetical protein